MWLMDRRRAVMGFSIVRRSSICLGGVQCMGLGAIGCSEIQMLLQCSSLHSVDDIDVTLMTLVRKMPLRLLGGPPVLRKPETYPLMSVDVR